LTRRHLFFIAIPLIAAAVIALAYFGAFRSPYVIAALVVLYIVVSIRNRRKFAKRKENS